MRETAALFPALVPILVFTATILGTPLVHAASVDNADLINALRAEIAALSDRLATIEDRQSIAEQTYRTPQPTAVESSAGSWADRIKVKGDVRYRHEAFDVDNQRDRHRQRVRARAQLSAEVSDTVSVVFGLASGNDDPVSSNQTLGDGSSSKSVVLDLAYARWQTPVDGLSITAGKFKNPFRRIGGHSLIWDGDLNPEGLSANYSAGDFFLNAGGFWLDESSSDDDSQMVGMQSGINTALGDGAVIAGVGYYNFLDSRGEMPFYDGRSRGNLVNGDGEYLSGFELLEGFAEYSIALQETNLTLFADYVKNLAADDYDTGWVVGAKLKRDKWQAGWAYQDLEADAVLGTFTDSDFVGGGTDGKGHMLQAGYNFGERIALRATLFLNERNIDFGNKEDFKRLMLDIGFKY